MAGPTGPGGNGQGAPQGEQPPIAFQIQYVKDFSFENPGAPDIFTSMNQELNFDFNINVESRALKNNHYEVVLNLRVDAKSAGKQVFISELAYAGIFQLGPQIPPEAVRPVLLVECPTLLFPFARAIIANATRDGGFPQLMLPPFNFHALYEQQNAGGSAAAPSSPLPKS